MSTVRQTESAATNAFAYGNFRRFFVGQSLSNVGSWFQLVAQALLVLKLTGKGSALGEVLAAQTIPSLFLGPFIGPFLDRARLQRVILCVTAFAGVEALALGLLTSTGHISVNLILGLSFLLGFAQIFMLPTNQTLISELVPPIAIPSAVSLSTVQQAFGRLAGPAAAAFVYVWRGAAACYDVNAISYLVVFIAVCSLRKDRLYPRRKSLRSPKQYRETFGYVWNSPAHRGQLLANLCIGCFSFNFPLCFSAFANFVLNPHNAHAGSLTFGWAESINAGVALIGGVILSHRLRRTTKKMYALACVALGGALGLTALAPNTMIFLIDMVIFGFCIVFYLTINQASLQMNTPSDRIGSVMALSTYGQLGTTPIGSLVCGWLIGVGTARAAIGAGAAVAVGAGLVMAYGAFAAGRSVVSGTPATAGTPAPAIPLAADGETRSSW